MVDTPINQLIGLLPLKLCDFNQNQEVNPEVSESHGQPLIDPTSQFQFSSATVRIQTEANGIGRSGYVQTAPSPRGWHHNRRGQSSRCSCREHLCVQEVRTIGQGMRMLGFSGGMAITSGICNTKTHLLHLLLL